MATNTSLAIATATAASLASTAGSNCTIQIRSGSAPTNADTTATGSLLVTLSYSGAALSASGNVCTINTGFTGTVSNSGTAGWARLIKSDGTTVICDWTSVGTSGSDVNLATTTLTASNTVSVTSGSITVPYP